MEKDILDSQDFYEVMQQYRHSNMDNQEQVVKAFENVKTWIRDNVLGNEEESDGNFGERLKEAYIDSQAPEWLTASVRKQVKETWDSHKVVNDRKRIDAMDIVRNTAKADGYEISIKKAMELMKKYCNIY